MDLRSNEIVLDFGHDWVNIVNIRLWPSLIDSISPKTQEWPIYFFQCSLHSHPLLPKAPSHQPSSLTSMTLYPSSLTSMTLYPSSLTSMTLYPSSLTKHLPKKKVRGEQWIWKKYSGHEIMKYRSPNNNSG